MAELDKTKGFRGTWKEFVALLPRKDTFKDDTTIQIIVTPTPEPSTKMELDGTSLPEPKPEPKRDLSSIDKRLRFGLDEHLVALTQAGALTVPPSPAWFRRKLQSILKDNAVHRTVANKLYGDLDFKKLYRITTTAKVFSRTDAIDKKQYNILLLVDASGSMHKAKMLTAVKAMITLTRDFQAEVALEVALFNTHYKTLKKFDEKIPVEELLAFGDISFSHLRLYGHNNHDHIALKEAGKRLLRRKGQKILLVLSDGAPSCDGSSTDCDRHCGKDMLNALIKTRKALEHLGITILSIGIASTAVEDYYTHSIVIQELPELYTALSTYMERVIKRIPIRV